MAMVFIPALMRPVAGGKDRVEIEGRTLREIVENLEKAYPGMKALLVADGQIQDGIALAVNGEPSEVGLMMEVPDGGEVQIMPAIAGG
ncbi:MAG: MoaD/ThiS family protein [Dehalococcoidia bacterium]